MHLCCSPQLLPAGSVFLNGTSINPDDHPLLSDMARGTVLCSDAEIRHFEGEWICDGDPTEGALVVAAMKVGLTPRHVHEHFPRTDVIPFESEHRFMATLHHGANGSGTIFVKGAPERLLEMCRLQHEPEGDVAIDHAYWLDKIHEVSANGMRVLALARRETGTR